MIAKSKSPFGEWLIDLASLIASVLCLTAMLILLLLYNNKAVPELSMGLTFNAIISVLVTAAKVTMLSAVSSAMGQIKWKWFRENRSPLRNLDLFDEASRGGPLGAIYFLARVRWSSTAAIGAIVLLLSLAMDPFAQQLLNYPVQLTYRDSPDASITFAKSVNPYHEDFDSMIQRYVTDAIWNNPRTFKTSCSSGNCTYPPFQSISWCPRCEDITNDVRLEGCDMAFDFTAPAKDPPPLSCNISISSSLNITTANRAILHENYEKSHGYPDSAFYLNPILTYVWEIHDAYRNHWTPVGGHGQIPFLGQPHSMLGIGQVDLDYDPTYPFQALKVKHATGCVMNPCIRQYKVTTSAGVTSIDSAKISDGIVTIVNPMNQKMPPWLHNSTGIPAACWVSNYTLLSNEDAGIHNPSYYPDDYTTLCANGNIFSNCIIDTQFALCDYEASRQADVIANLLSGNKSIGLVIMTRLLGTNLTAYRSDEEHVLPMGTDYSSYTFQEMIQHRGLNATLQSIAEYLTAMMLSISTDTITGQVGHAQALVHVDWVWLLYPVVVIFIGIAFVLYTIAETTWIDKGPAHVWKNSTLPLVYHGLLDGVTNSTRIRTMELRDMQKRASETVVRFEGVGLKRV